MSFYILILLNMNILRREKRRKRKKTMSKNGERKEQCFDSSVKIVHGGKKINMEALGENN